MKNKFYVYEHWRPDKDLPFYVGKGKGSRAQSSVGRNKHYKNIVSKLMAMGMCIEVRMVECGMDEKSALALEVEKIASWKALGVKLVNITNGGEGTSGRILSEESKAKISRAASLSNKGRVFSAETRAKISAKHKGQVISLSHRMSISRANKTRVLSDESHARMSAAQKAKVVPPFTAEHCARISAANKGRLKGLVRSAETRARMTLAQRKRRKMEQERIRNQRARLEPLALS